MSDKPIAIVTGVGPGTGSAIVRRFAAEGFRVIALARSPDRIRALEQELTDTHAMICDVSSESQVAEAVARHPQIDTAPRMSSSTTPWEAGGGHFSRSSRKCSIGIFR